MALPTAFAALTQATGQMLDNNFAALGKSTPLPCTIIGTNALTLTPLVDNPSLTAYNSRQIYTGIAAATNSSTVTVQVGSLSVLNVYKDSVAGPVLLVGGEIVADNAVLLVYDPALNAGNGGFHLVNRTPYSRIVTATATLTFASLVPGATDAQNMTVTGALVGDSVMLGYPATFSAGIGYLGFVAASGTITVRATNIAVGTTITPTAGTYRGTAIGFT